MCCFDSRVHVLFHINWHGWFASWQGPRFKDEKGESPIDGLGRPGLVDHFHIGSRACCSEVLLVESLNSRVRHGFQWGHGPLQVFLWWVGGYPGVQTLPDMVQKQDVDHGQIDERGSWPFRLHTSDGESAGVCGTRPTGRLSESWWRRSFVEAFGNQVSTKRFHWRTGWDDDSGL